ncbi:malate:quinone oxidoreductase [Maribacter orientalis]|nr:malate:quinone oxidoreductase [Maribacter orientalis]
MELRKEYYLICVGVGVGIMSATLALLVKIDKARS